MSPTSNNHAAVMAGIQRRRNSNHQSFRSFAACLLACGVGVGVLAACGDDGDSTGAPTEPTTTDETATAPAEPTTTDETATAPAEPSTVTDEASTASADPTAAPDDSVSGEVNWYVSMPQPGPDGIAAAFADRYPNVAVNVYQQPTDEAWQRIRSEAAAGQHTADVFSYNGWWILNDGKEQGLFAPYLPASIGDTHDEIYYEPDEYAFSIRNSCMIIAYNTDQVSSDEVPTTWMDLGNERWADGRIASGDPELAILIYDFYWQMWNSPDIGQPFFDVLGAQNPLIYTGSGQLANAVVSGEVDIAIVQDFAAYREAAAGAPVAVVYPEGPQACSSDSNSLLAEAPNPDAAKLFLDFLATPEAGTIAAASGHVLPVAAGSDMAPEDIASGRPALDELTFLPTDRELQAAQMDEFNAMFNEVVR